MLVHDDQHSEWDRRTSPRVRITRPCKIHDPRSGKYFTGSTRDVSCGGALVDIDRPLDLSPGATIYVGVAEKRRQPLIRQHEMLEMRVIRVLQTADGRTILAGQWQNPALSTAVAVRRAA